MKVYIASALTNYARVQGLMAMCRHIGYTIAYDWTTHNQVFEKVDLERIGKLERDGVRDCDVFVMIHPAAFGSHVELGIAIALEKKILILEDHPPKELKSFYYLPEIQRFNIMERLITALKDHHGKC